MTRMSQRFVTAGLLFGAEWPAVVGADPPPGPTPVIPAVVIPAAPPQIVVPTPAGWAAPGGSGGGPPPAAPYGGVSGWAVTPGFPAVGGAPPSPPNGYYLRQYTDAQVAKAEFQRLFVLAHEWYLGGSTLGPSGRRHLDRLARGLLDCGGTIYLEPADNAKLNEPRRVAIVAALLQYGVRDADARVAVAYPAGEGLYGDDAVRLYPRLFLNRGVGGGGGSGFGGGTSLGGVGGVGGGGVGGLGGARGY